MIVTSEIIGKRDRPIIMFIDINSNMNNQESKEMLYRIANNFGITKNNAEFLHCDESFPIENIISEIESSCPLTIMTVGSSALMKLLPEIKSGITKNRGKLFKLADKFILIPTIHPTYIIKNPTAENMNNFSDDIRLCVRVAGEVAISMKNNQEFDHESFISGLKKKGLQANKAETEIILNSQQFDEFCKENVDPYDEIGYDVETNALPVMDQNHRIVGFSLASGKTKGCYVPLRALDFKIPKTERELIKQRLVQILENKNKDIWVYNCQHEIPVTWNWTNYFMENVKDLYVIAKLMNCGKRSERGQMGLKYLCMSNLGLQDWSEDLDEYFVLLKNLDEPNKDNRMKLKAMLSRYYDGEELEKLIVTINNLYDLLVETGEIKNPVLSYEYVPYKLIGRYGSLDASNMFGLRDFYYKKMNQENKIFGIDMYKGFDLWMKHHIAGATLEMNGAYWNDEKAEALGNWCTTTMKECMQKLLVHPLTEGLLKQRLTYDFSIVLMKDFLTEILKSDFVPVRLYKDSINLEIKNDIATKTIEDIIQSRVKENEDRVDRNDKLSKELKRKLKVTEIERPVSVPEIKQDKQGRQTVKLDTETFLMLAESQGFIKANPYLFRNWFNNYLKEFNASDPSIEDMKNLFNITATSREFKIYLSKILITQDVKLAHFLCALCKWLESPDFQSWMIKEDDKEFMDKVYEIMSISDDLYDPEKFKEFKQLFSNTSNFHSIQLINLFKESMNYELAKLDSGAIEELYNYYGMMEMNIDDDSTWSPEYVWMFNYKVFKKLSKVYTTYVYGNSTGRGNVSYVDKKQLESGGDFCRRLGNYDDNDKDKRSKGLDTIINSGFFVNGATTGRWQSGMHNISNGDPKNTYTSRFKGGTIMAPDYSGVEIKMIAAISGDETLLGAIRDGLDVHTLTASLIFKIPMEEVSKRQRALSKNATFHILYGGSVKSFANSYCKGDMHQAEEIINGYFNAYPRIKEYIDRMHKQVTQYDRVVTRTNRIVHVEKVIRNGKEDTGARLRESQNFPIQASAEDCAGSTLYDICMLLRNYPKYVKENNIDGMRKIIRDQNIEKKIIKFLQENPRDSFYTKPFCFIHDSIENDVYPDELFLMQDTLSYFFNVKSAEDWDVPFSSDITIGPSMGQEIEVEDLQYSDDYNEGTFILSGYLDDINQLVDGWRQVYKVVEESTIEGEEDKSEKISWGLMMSKLKAPIKSTFGKTLIKGKRKFHIEYYTNYIRFIDFMKLYNFRNYNSNATTEGYDMDTDIIRIRFADMIEDSYKKDKWFEFGIYDFGSKKELVSNLNYIFSDKILKSYVYSFRVNEEIGILEIELTDQPGDLYDD